MKKSLGVIFASLIVVCGLSATSFAQTGHNRHLGSINQRQERQQDRIAQGIKSGSLNPREAARLERQSAHINRVERRYRRSGDGLSLRERAKLERDLNRTSHHIYGQKHDANRGANHRLNQ